MQIFPMRVFGVTTWKLEILDAKSASESAFCIGSAKGLFNTILVYWGFPHLTTGAWLRSLERVNKGERHWLEKFI